MTMVLFDSKEELKEEIAMVIWAERLNPYNETATKILTLIRKAGWKSPEEVDNIKGLIKQLRDNSEEDYGAYGFHVQSKAAWTALMNVLKK